jgi:trans-aconitate 2-methyltransferase
MWNPTTYLRFAEERSRPFFDLVARVGADTPRAVVDLGCGPGNLTVTLAQRWPRARITGLDSSPEMIARAQQLDSPVGFGLTDLREWSPTPEVDVVVSNAALQWVPGHEKLLTRWAEQLPSGAWLAFQVPGNFDHAAHRALAAVARQPRWGDAVAPLLRSDDISDPPGYAVLLARAGCTVDAWETTYAHILPIEEDGEHPVLAWLEGTALRPVRASLPREGDWSDFKDDLRAQLAEAYPVESFPGGAAVLFPFRRIFVVARTLA